MKICDNCHFMGKGTNSFWDGYLYNSILLILGIIGILLQGDFFGSQIIFNVFMVYLIVSSTVQIAKNYYGGKICPKCNHKPMLALDDPEAIKLIKQYDLEPGDNSAPDTFKEPSTRSSSKAPES